MLEQVAQRDSRPPLIDNAARRQQIGQVVDELVVERQLAGLHQLQDGHGRHGLGNAADPHHRGRLHRPPRSGIGKSDGPGAVQVARDRHRQAQAGELKVRPGRAHHGGNGRRAGVEGLGWSLTRQGERRGEHERKDEKASHWDPGMTGAATPASRRGPGADQPL